MNWLDRSPFLQFLLFSHQTLNPHRMWLVYDSPTYRLYNEKDWSQHSGASWKSFFQVLQCKGSGPESNDLIPLHFLNIV